MPKLKVLVGFPAFEAALASNFEGGKEKIAAVVEAGGATDDAAAVVAGADTDAALEVAASGFEKLKPVNDPCVEGKAGIEELGAAA